MNITQAEFDILGNKNKRIFDEYLRVSGKSKELSKGKKKSMAFILIFLDLSMIYR